MGKKFKLDSKTIIILLIIGIVSIIGYGINYCFYSPSPVNKYIASNLYKTPANSAFKDDNFYRCVVDRYNHINDTNIAYTKSLTNTQLKTITYLACEDKNIKDVSGIEKLISLTDLNVDSNQITSLDVSKNPALKYLDANYNQLTSLNVNGATALETLWVNENQLTSLDVSNNLALTILHAEKNQITSLNVNGATALKKLYTYENQLTSLDVSHNPALEYLEANYNQLTSLNVNGATALETLLVNENQLTSLNVNGATALKTLWVNSNQLTSLDVSKNPALTELMVSSNQLTSLDVSGATALTELFAWNNQLTSLDVSNNPVLEYLDASGNQLTSLDVSQNPALKDLDASDNQLTSLDVSNNPALKDLDASGNQLTSLDVSNNPALKDLDASGNQLTSLDVSDNPALTELFAWNNQLTSLDVSKNMALIKLDIHNFDYYDNKNQITSLDVSNNLALTILHAEKNQITSLNVNGATALETLWVNENQLTSLDISHNPALTYLNVSKNQLTSLDVSHNPALEYLDANYNQLTSLNVSQNSKLWHLDVSSNQLTSLDVSQNPALTTLNISNNQLTSLDISHNPALKTLYADNNQLTSLDISHNPALTVLRVWNNPFGESHFVFLGDKIENLNFGFVKLPNNFNLTLTYNVSSGLSLENNIITANKIGKQTYQLISEYPSYEETYTIEVVDITSNKYVIDKNKSYIDIGNDTNEEVLNNITVLNGEAVIEEDELVVKNGEDEVKRFKLLSTRSSVYDLTKEYIYVGNDKDDEIISNIETNANINIENNMLNISYDDDYRISYKLIRHNLKETYLYGVDNETALSSIEVINGEKSIKDNNIVISYGNVELDRIPILNISSNDYVIGDYYVYTKFKNFDVNKINKSEGLELVVSNEQLDILYAGKTLDSKTILSLSMNSEVLKVNNSKNEIYIKDGIEVSYDDFINSIIYNDIGLYMEVYNLEKGLIEDGNVTEGYELRIIDYDDNVIGTYNIAIEKEFVDYIDSDKVHYTDTYGIDILKNLSIDNTFINVRELIETDGVISITDKDGNTLEESTKIKTGDRFKVTFPTSEYFIHLSVKGDVRGTGKIENEDVLESYQILRGDKEVEEYYRLATDMNNDGKLKINDVAKLYQYTKNKIENLD